MPEVFTIAQAPVTCHTLNADRSQLAASVDSNDANIYTRQGSEWVQIDTLSQHDKLITSIDWAPNSNRIVTASQDRNAYVWSPTVDPTTGRMSWKPTLVLLRINRAATFVRWSPFEDKFAVASGARAIAVCSFDPENDWWVSRLLKKPIRSTVLSLDWHPNNVLLAAGSADMKARVFSAFIKDTDKKPQPSVWGEKLPFNTLCGEYGSASGGWVHAVGFSPSGDALAFASHDSTVTIVYPGSGAMLTVKSITLPHVTLTWTSENAFVAAGHDCQPILYKGSEQGWAADGSLDDTTAPKAGGSGLLPKAATSGVGRLNSAAYNTFRNADIRGQTGVPRPGSPTTPGSGGGNTESELLTVHQNTITSIRPYDGVPGGNVSKVVTTGVDGKLVIWDVTAVGDISTKMAQTRLR